MRGRSLAWACVTRWIASDRRICSLFLVLALASSAWSEENVLATSKSSANRSPAKDERNLLQRTGWIRLELVGGRIAVLGHRCGQSRVLQTGEATDTPREKLSVQLCSEALVVHYEDVRDDEQVLFDLDDQRRLTIRRKSASPSAEITFAQPFQGPVTVSVGREPAQTYTACSIWHLTLKHPELCEESLFPLLESLRPHWRLSEQADAIQAALVRKSGSDVLARQALWRKWVSQLDSDNFAERQNADRQLRSAGQAVSAWLRRLDQKQLSPEQAGRVQEICQSLTELSIDSPQRVALWMIDDRCAWISLLQHADSDVRLAAANHLTVLCGKPVAFDPYASAADREQQLAQLQQRFSKP